MRKQFVLTLALLCLAIAVPHVVAADTWPKRPVRLISPFPSGSGIDVSARLYADRLAARWGQPVIVENRPGGDGIIGSLPSPHSVMTTPFCSPAAPPSRCFP